MKKVRFFAVLLGATLAVGGSFAFRPNPTITGYQFVSTPVPQCLRRDVDCGTGQATCTILGITYFDTESPESSCGAALKMP